MAASGAMAKQLQWHQLRIRSHDGPPAKIDLKAVAIKEKIYFFGGEKKSMLFVLDASKSTRSCWMQNARMSAIRHTNYELRASRRQEIAAASHITGEQGGGGRGSVGSKHGLHALILVGVQI